jgi:hypothetical protein
MLISLRSRILSTSTVDNWAAYAGLDHSRPAGRRHLLSIAAESDLKKRLEPSRTRGAVRGGFFPNNWLQSRLESLNFASVGFNPTDSKK